MLRGRNQHALIPAERILGSRYRWDCRTQGRTREQDDCMYSRHGPDGPRIEDQGARSLRASRKWSWKVGEISGIAISVHATFLLLVAWFAMAFWFEVGNLARVASGVALLLLLFGCVLLHELGHALTAQRFGFKTREITLLPIGGVANLERMPDDPKQSLWITLAGPAVNIAIAAALFVALRVTGAWRPIAGSA